MGDALGTDDLDLDAVNTRDELASRLRMVRTRADLSLRNLESRTHRNRTPRSKSAISDMLRGVRFPRKAVMIAFLRACEVPGDQMESWLRAWDRVAPHEGRRTPSVARQAARGQLGQGPVRHPASTGGQLAMTTSWHFSTSGPVTIICAQLPREQTSALADPADPNYTELLSYADLDALIVLYGHLCAENSAVNVFFKLSSNVVPDDLSGHVVLLGGIAWNDKTQPLSEMTSLPVRQIEDPAIKTGEIFVVEINGKEEKFLPKWKDGKNLVEDVGLIARMPNPLNSNQSLMICNGVHSRGVLGAVRCLTNTRLRDSNERYIEENFADPSNFAILMRVRVISGQAMTPDFHAPGCVLYRWSGA